MGIDVASSPLVTRAKVAGWIMMRQWVSSRSIFVTSVASSAQRSASGVSFNADPDADRRRLLPGSFCSMWRDEDPAASERIVSTVRNVVEYGFRHLRVASFQPRGKW